MKVRMKSIMAGPDCNPAMLYQEIDVDDVLGNSLIHGGHATLVVTEPAETATPEMVEMETPEPVETADNRPNTKEKRGKS